MVSAAETNLKTAADTQLLELQYFDHKHTICMAFMPDKKVLLTNSAQPPAVTLGRAVATREADQFISLLKVSRLLGDSRSSDETDVSFI